MTANDAAKQRAALSASLLEVNEQMSPLFDHADGIRADMERRGWSPTAAEQAALSWLMGALAQGLEGGGMTEQLELGQALRDEGVARVDAAQDDWWRRLPDQVRAKIVRQDGGCWVWTGAVTSAGYGNLHIRPRNYTAHRFVYEAKHGAVSPALYMDHLCRNTRCCNPEHLEPVTPRENVVRGTSPGALAVQTGACHLGHPFSAENTYRRGGWRWCRTCNNARQAVIRAQKKETSRGAA
jgi:hypothetical protein